MRSIWLSIIGKSFGRRTWLAAGARINTSIWDDRAESLVVNRWNEYMKDILSWKWTRKPARSLNWNWSSGWIKEEKP